MGAECHGNPFIIMQQENYLQTTAKLTTAFPSPIQCKCNRASSLSNSKKSNLTNMLESKISANTQQCNKQRITMPTS